VSLIADALKAAQHEKTQRMPAPAGSSGFFPVRPRPRSESIPRPLLYTLAAIAGIGGLAAVVTLLLTSHKRAPNFTGETPSVLQPGVSPPQALAPAPTSGSAAALTDSASAIPVEVAEAATLAPPPRAPAPVVASDQTAIRVAPTRAAGASTPMGDAAGTPLSRDTAQLAAAGLTAAEPSPSRPGTLKIMMEQRPVADIGQLFQQALAAQRRGDLTGARELYLKALERDPGNADLYNNLGTLYRATAELDRAEDAYRHAISLNPRLAAAWSNLGVLLDARGRTKEAIAALQQAMTVDPSNADTKVNLALQYHAAGLYPDAKRLLEDAVRTNPAMPEAQYALARTLEAQGDRNGAVQHYDLFLSTSNGRFPVLEMQVRKHLTILRGG